MKNLCRAIFWSACFLEMSADDVVDPDSAVKALEDIASTLLQSTEEEKLMFAEACAEEAVKLQEKAGDERTAKFVRGLPEAMGL